MNTTEYMKLLPLELGQLKDEQLLEPESEIRYNDVVVGEMTDIQKKLYTLMSLKERATDEYLVAYKYETDDSKKREIFGTGSKCAFEARLLNCLFWMSVNDEFSLWEYEKCGARKGWKIVRSKRTMNTNFLDFLQDMLGDR